MSKKINISKSAQRWPKLMNEEISDEGIIASKIKSAPFILISPVQSSRLSISSKVIENEVSRAISKSSENSTKNLPSELWLG